jgi:hypothetical protein
MFIGQISSYDNFQQQKMAETVKIKDVFNSSIFHFFVANILLLCCMGKLALMFLVITLQLNFHLNSYRLEIYVYWSNKQLRQFPATKNG